MTLITVSGLPGSGTTTLASRLARRLEFQHHSTGQVFRQMAADRGLSIEEFGALVDATPQIDRDLDAEMVRTVKATGSCIAEGRLTGMLFRDADLKILCYAPDDVRAARVLSRSGETKEQMHRREVHEMRRHRDTYGFDSTMISLYDICINTERYGPDRTEALARWALAAGRCPR